MRQNGLFKRADTRVCDHKLPSVFKYGHFGVRLASGVDMLQLVADSRMNIPSE